MNDDLYRGITDFAHDTPSSVHAFAAAGTEGGLVLLAILLALACLRSARRADGPYGRAAALLAGCALVVAYGLSEAVKLLVTEERPCRAVPDAAPPLAACPAPGDWSFPSNHATLALAAATGVALLWRGLAWLAVPVGLLTAFSRVFVGVHYPFDVLVGGLLGAAVAAACVSEPLVRRGARLLLHRRASATATTTATATATNSTADASERDQTSPAS